MTPQLKHVTTGVAFPILIALSLSHCLNDLLQSVITAVYPMIKEDLSLNFTQIGLITLVYQLAASVFQPVVGLVFDKRPLAWSLPFGMCFTTVGLMSLAYATQLHWILLAVFLVGIGSSVLHPEASRITSLASGGRRGLAQSLFQVGGNFGGSVGPLLVALLVAPYGRNSIVVFGVISLLAFVVMRPVCRWYGKYLHALKEEHSTFTPHIPRPLSLGPTVFAICILMILIFSKYIYMASLSSYYTFYLIHKFGVTVQASQIYLFVFLVATAVGTLIGGPVGDRKGRKFVIWVSILGTAPFSMLMPHVGLAWTVVFSFCVGFMLSSAFPSILLYAQELLPNKLGLISGLFFGFAFGVAGIASAILGGFADTYGIETVYNVCAYMPLLGLVTYFLPDLKKR
ncbi:MFS transporter [Bacteroides helcogenes]|uniref:Major facilitator superfamily MFS_1 n=1 Tax=Bacteroides helcogenes (strain ATCC 35417 / DSM 20613 / JCM 6297 / CCUG 15421 / P 36-108) TaxID=693979 RepID=E6SQV5_BACT6|nr:MFS transporter [Bacteroides helcogenes]ADV44038.1 major facilitator superfamily MFS_1 [Bacteroides helcogenes P 36-108]MDY5237861.1 MFS transporter [Bacteroides helcogenes]